MSEKISLTLDLNVLLDVVQQREPFYEASAAVLTMALDGRVQAFLPPHAVATLYYIVRKTSGKENADRVVDRLLPHLEIAPTGKTEILRARGLEMEDFEDALVACAAEAAGCVWIVTRNLEDFGNSPVAAITPEEILAYGTAPPDGARSQS